MKICVNILVLIIRSRWNHSLGEILVYIILYKTVSTILNQAGTASQSTQLAENKLTFNIFIVSVK